METWTFFCKNGSHDGDFRANRDRYVCYGVRSSVTVGQDSTGHTKNQLTLWIPAGWDVLETEEGEKLPLTQAILRPGDFATVGICDTGDDTCWHITGVKGFHGGRRGGWVITAA